MFFIHHFIRPIWNIPITLIYWFIYFLYVNTNVSIKNEYESVKSVYDGIKSIDELISFIKKYYRYKWDGYKGFFDHNNSTYEFFTESGDCDDISYYVCKVIKKLEGYKPIKIGIISSKVGSWHYDCIIHDTTINKFYLFNYGTIKPGNSIQECIDNINWSLFPVGKTKWWKCWW